MALSHSRETVAGVGVSATAPSDVVVVLPTYNESANLAELAAAVRDHGYRLLVVDDSSPDGTGDLADELAAGDDHVTVLHRPEKAGLGPAYAAGFRAAIETGATVICEMDADFSHDPSDLPRLVEAVDQGADVVVGSRYVPGGSTVGWPVHRRALSKGGNLYARVLLGLPIHDATGGFRAFRAECLARLDPSTAESSGYAFQIEMIRRAVDARLTIVEVPIVFRERERGASKMSASIAAEAILFVTAWGWQRLRGRFSRR